MYGLDPPDYSLRKLIMNYDLYRTALFYDFIQHAFNWSAIFQLRTRFAIVICYFLLLFFCFRATDLNHFSLNEKT